MVKNSRYGSHNMLKLCTEPLTKTTNTQLFATFLPDICEIIVSTKKNGG